MGVETKNCKIAAERFENTFRAMVRMRGRRTPEGLLKACTNLSPQCGDSSLMTCEAELHGWVFRMQCPMLSRMGNDEFASLHSYDSYRRHRNARGTLCSDESSKSDIIFAWRAGLTTGTLRQHSLANAKLGALFTLHIISSNNPNNTIIIKSNHRIIAKKSLNNHHLLEIKDTYLINIWIK